MVKVKITPTGIRNEYWRGQLKQDVRVPQQYARLYMTRGVKNHPMWTQALAALLAGPAQMDEGINPWGDCDMLKVSLGGETFYLKVDCYGKAETMDQGTEDPTDDEKTIRVFTCLLASEY
jgi:hypothetical protein